MNQEILKAIQRQKIELEKQINAIKKKNIRKAEGTLYAYRHRGKDEIQYYISGMPTVPRYSRSRKYAIKSDRHIVKELAAREYHDTVVDSLQEEFDQLDQLEKFYLSGGGMDAYRGFNYLKRSIVQPYFESDELYRERWENAEFQHKILKETESSLVTDRGERVRSKSEILIANMLYRMNIPYRYECALVLSDQYIFYPDFTILDIMKRREVYFEHFGMMDDPKYATDAIKRINIYEKNGIVLGDNLFVDFETRENPLNIKNVEKMLKQFVPIHVEV